MVRGERNTDRNVRKFITITDIGLWEKIDEIMTLPQYQKSFNKVINEALFYGLDELHRKLFETVEEESEMQTIFKTVRRIDGLNEDIFYQIVKLLKEVILNATINKSILCSLFEAKSLELCGEKVNAKKFSDGAFRDTPDYLTAYELRALRDLRK